MYDAPLEFIVSCLVYLKKYSAKCDYNQTGQTCPASGACPGECGHSVNKINYVAIMTIGCEASSGHVHTLSGAFLNAFERAP